MTGRVTLAGAGCGNYDLITLRGIKVLSVCDTVVYDSLIDERLLEFCPPEAEKICVGKRAGKHSAIQEEINELLIKKAMQGKNVVRLKGGDPFVFGRGGEEIQTLQAHSIPYDIVPGITSSVAVAELAGIPVTHRKIARSFHVITGHTAQSNTPDNLEYYAKLNGTLVFLMGLGSLESISNGLISGGMPSETPAAVISDGASVRQRIVRSSLKNITEEVKKAQLKPPAVIVVGETAEYDFSATYKPPLDNVNISVTSSPETGRQLMERLDALGAYVYRNGSVDVKEVFSAEMDTAFENIRKYSCIALTSPNGARIFLKKLREKRIDIRMLTGIRFAVIGRGTAGVLENSGIFPEIMPEHFNSQELGKVLAENISDNEKLLIMRSSEGSEELNRQLDSNNVKYDDMNIYEPVYTSGSYTNADYAVFTSSGAVRSFFENGSISAETRVVAIGGVTAEELKKHGISDCLIPRESTVQGIVDMITEDIEK